jgi:hypothetical protein
LPFKIYQNKKKIEINALYRKLEHLKKLVKKIAILIYPPFGIFRKKLFHKVPKAIIALQDAKKLKAKKK